MYSPYGESTLSYAVSTPELEMVKISNLCTDPVLFADMAPLPPRDQRHPWLRYQVEGSNEDIIHNYEQRLETIFDSCLLATRGGDCLRPEDAEGAHDKVEGDQAVPTPVQSPQPPPPAPVRNIA
ncbi:hypothetical protein Tco_0618186 [Tanacetum coccineum]